MINHPQYEFPKFIQFTNARPQGFILTINQVKEIIKDDKTGFFYEWNQSQKHKVMILML